MMIPTLPFIRRAPVVDLDRSSTAWSALPRISIPLIPEAFLEVAPKFMLYECKLQSHSGWHRVHGTEPTSDCANVNALALL